MIQAIMAVLTVFHVSLFIRLLVSIYRRWDQSHRIVNRIRRINPS